MHSWEKVQHVRYLTEFVFVWMQLAEWAQGKLMVCKFAQGLSSQAGSPNGNISHAPAWVQTDILSTQEQPAASAAAVVVFLAPLLVLASRHV